MIFSLKNKNVFSKHGIKIRKIKCFEGCFFFPQCNKTALVRPVLAPALTALCLPQAGSPPGSGGASFAAGPACSRWGQSPSTTSLTARHCCTSSTSRRGTSPTTAGTGTLSGGTRPCFGLVRWGRELPPREGRHRCSHLAEMLLFPQVTYFLW